MTAESLADRTLRWMNENVQGAYLARGPNGVNYCVNSGTCVLIFCYMQALGKVLLKGQSPPRRDYARFRSFLLQCMPDLLAECSAKAFPETPKHRHGGDEWLYEVARCGFVHQFYPGIAGWTRARDSQEYWLMTTPSPVINIDQFVRGFEAGLVRFRALLSIDRDMGTRFGEYLGS